MTFLIPKQKKDITEQNGYVGRF